MIKIKSILNILFSERFVPRLRGMFNGLIHHQSSPKTIIYRPTCFTGKNIRLGKGVFLYKFCRIQAITRYLNVDFNPLISLGDNVSIQQNCHITCAERIFIGSNTSIAANVTITDIDHPYTDIKVAPERQPIKVKPVAIGEDCKIYNNAVILYGVKIGKHCVIGANTVVNRDIPDYCVAVGIPARIVKRYNFETKSWERTTPDGEFIDQNG